jgi:hypothetical protein
VLPALVATAMLRNWGGCLAHQSLEAKMVASPGLAPGKL